MTNFPPGFFERFFSKVDVWGDCWEWQACVSLTRGYGRVSVHSKSAYAHRVAYELLVGPIPAGLQLDHLCRNRRCVNPDHLEPVTPRTNVFRAVTVATLNAAKTHCPRDHPYSPENTYYSKGSRFCIACVEIRAAKRYGREVRT